MSTFQGISLSINSVATSLTPRQLNSGVGTLASAGPNGSLVGQVVATTSNRLTPSKRQKGRVKVAIPKVVTETVNGVEVPKVLGYSYLDIVVDLDPTFTTVESEAVLATGLDILNKTKNASLAAILVGRQNVHG